MRQPWINKVFFFFHYISLTEARRWQSAAYCKKYMFENATYLIRGKHGQDFAFIILPQALLRGTTISL